MKPKKIQQGTVEDQIAKVLRERGCHATTESELKELSGVTGLSFKEAIIRLKRKNQILRWRSPETLAIYIILIDHAECAFYNEPVSIPEIYLAMGHSKTQFMLKRQIPIPK